MRTVSLALALSVAAFAARPAVAEIYAVTVGIDTYETQHDLKGAVADANDIYDSLRAFGARDIVLLLNEQADRTAIRDAWRRMADQVGPGDTFVFHYSGHGGREPDANGDEVADNFPDYPEDTMDETLILSGFSPENASDIQWRIIDDEIQEWTRDITRRGAAVLMVADSCFSGTLTRGGGPGRSIELYGDPQQAGQMSRGWVGAGRPAAATPAPEPTSRGGTVYLLSASDQAFPVNEVRIEGATRGALSYAFARALDEADADGDGALLRSELEGFVISRAQNVDEQSAGPELSPPAERGEDPVILRSKASAAPQGAESAEPDFDHRTRLRLVGEAWDALPPGIGQTAVPTEDDPDLTYDAATGRLSDYEDVTVAENLSLEDLQAAAAKYMVLQSARNLGAQPPMMGVLEPKELIYSEGERVTAGFGPLMRPYLTIVNLAADGRVQPVFPHRRRPEQSTAQRLYRMLPVKLRVGAPYGADHLLAISTDAPPTALRRSIRRGLSATELAQWIAGPGRDMDAAYGIIAFYSEDAQ